MPPLQQKHKSTGNLASMASTQNAGFRGPAKRAAFGDMTNVAKNVGNGRDEAKNVKIQVVNGTSHGPASVALGRENTGYNKESFSRPAQRSTVLATKSKATNENQIHEPTRRSARNAQQEQIGSNNTSKDIHITKASIVAQTSHQAPALQPRHHKSQPQLKQQQPTLRRTQSKQFEKLAPRPDPVEEESYLEEEVEPVVMARHEANYTRTHAAYLDSLYLPLEDEEHLPVNHEDDCVDLPSKLPEISEEEALVSISYQETHIPAMSEPEECWDEEDDEDYDDQDQAYTTAHSFRSRDYTSGGATTVLAPRVTAKIQRELEDAAVDVEHTRSPDDIEEELWDVSMVAEYGDEIFEYMRKLEVCVVMCVCISKQRLTDMV